MSTCRNSQQLVGEDAPALWRVVPRALLTLSHQSPGLPSLSHVPQEAWPHSSHSGGHRYAGDSWMGAQMCSIALRASLSLCRCPEELAVCPGPTLCPGFSLLAGPGIIASDVIASEQLRWAEHQLCWVAAVC